jgi:DNA-binding transcriptional LysR family regulator
VGLDTRISLQKLEIFCLVVELGGVGKAAEHLYVAQPVVSAHLRTLQDRLGAQLLYRDGRRMRLTDAGEAAYAWAKEVLSRSQEVVREIEGLTEGSAGGAVIAASMTVGSYVLPPILSRFRQTHPLARITLQVSDPEHALHQTETGVSDFAILATVEPIEPRLFAAEEIGTEELVLVAGADDDQVGERVMLDALGSLRYVCSPGGLARRRLVETALRDIGVQQRDIVIELGHPEAMKQAAKDGLGVAVLFRSSVARELAEGSLRRVDIEGVRMPVPILLIRRSAKRLSPLQSQLADAIRGALTER